MKIAGEFFGYREICRLAHRVAAAQPYFNLSGSCFGNDGKYAVWAKSHDLRGCISDQNGAARRITGIEPGTVNDDLTTCDGKSRIDVDDFRSATHKSRQSYDEPQKGTKGTKGFSVLRLLCLFAAYSSFAPVL
jgi:hypothetical protein